MAGDRRGLARRLADYIGRLTVAQGPLRGQRFEVMPWQRRFLRGFAENDQSVLSLARGGGKSSFLAAISAACVDPSGPLFEPMSEVSLVAPSSEQCRAVFRHVRQFVAPLAEAKVVRIQDNRQAREVSVPGHDTIFRALPCDSRKLHGGQPKMILVDEPAQMGQKGEELAPVIRTSLGKLAGAKLCVIGTRPRPGGARWFSRMMEPGSGAHSEVYCASEDSDWRKPGVWERANPSIRGGRFPLLRRTIARECLEAQAEASLVAGFQALRLNTGGAETEQQWLVSPGVWRERCEAGDDDLPPKRGRLVWGCDLGGSGAMSAVVARWPDTGRTEALAAFPETPSLAERGRKDGVADLYERMLAGGELIQRGEFVVDVLGLFRAALDRFGQPERIVGDAWRETDLRSILRALGLSAKFERRGMGFAHGSSDIRSFRECVLRGEVRVRRSLLFRTALAEARTAFDSANNERMASDTEGGRRKRARDDVAVALVHAVGCGVRLGQRQPAVIAGPGI